MSDKQDEQIRLLKEILKWLKFTGMKGVRDVLVTELDTDQKRLIYTLSDGTHGSVEIGKAANVSDRTVRRYWDSWSRLGIAEPVAVRGGIRTRKSFELEDFGFVVPQAATLPSPDNKQSGEQSN